MTGKWTIKRLNGFDGRPLPKPWHAIPPHTPIPPREVSHHSMFVLYQDDGVSAGVTYDEVMGYVNEQIRGSGMPQIIRTVQELKALDPETLLISNPLSVTPAILPAGHLVKMRLYSRLGKIAVIATGDQIRAAGKALEGA